MLKISMVKRRQELLWPDEFEARLHPANCDVVEESVKQLVLADFSRRQERKQMHGYAIRGPNNPAVRFPCQLDLVIFLGKIKVNKE